MCLVLLFVQDLFLNIHCFVHGKVLIEFTFMLSLAFVSVYPRPLPLVPPRNIFTECSLPFPGCLCTPSLSPLDLCVK